MLTSLVQDDCVARCKAEEAQGVTHIVSCEQGCGTIATRTGPPVTTGPLIAAQWEEPECPWYLVAKRAPSYCPEGQSCIAVVQWQQGCQVNLPLYGILAGAALLLIWGMK